MNIPAWGYGMRYTYGMFHQRIENGQQVEFPEFWLTFGDPWEIERLDVQYLIQFGGNVTQTTDPSTGQPRVRYGLTKGASGYCTLCLPNVIPFTRLSHEGLSQVKTQRL